MSTAAVSGHSSCYSCTGKTLEEGNRLRFFIPRHIAIDLPSGDLARAVTVLPHRTRTKEWWVKPRPNANPTGDWDLDREWEDDGYRSKTLWIYSVFQAQCLAAEMRIRDNIRSHKQAVEKWRKAGSKPPDPVIDNSRAARKKRKAAKKAEKQQEAEAPGPVAGNTRAASKKRKAAMIEQKQEPPPALEEPEEPEEAPPMDEASSKAAWKEVFPSMSPKKRKKRKTKAKATTTK